MFSLRSATRADIPIVCGFLHNPIELFRFFPKAHYPLTPEQLEQGSFQSRSDQTLLLWHDEAVGFADLYDLRQGEGCFIGHVIVDGSCRGRGGGRFLVEGMVQIARSRHQVRMVRLSCFSDNTPALLMYHHLGFRPYAMETRHTPDGSAVPMLHLERCLVGAANRD
ncbi:MAG: GNAT family N-acetyltransferase [Magnetococcales bacterium]|nr:GNAT family N-acetyltransferase [Magnetococcales bacterium]MBF0322171.1 GNAT family N-acetyltransferase [Magnetococcales bacterium]